MLAGVHVDTAGVFFRRALESMHNNFAIYCGLVMVHCRCYIGLECTILFLSETHSVGCGPLRPLAPLMIFTTKPDDWLENPPE